MKRLFVLLCLLSLCAATVLNPRGSRPVEQGTRSEKCDDQREWPFCTDDQWGPKCPSGCRMQGLMDKYDHDTLKRIEKIRSLLQQNEAKHRSANQVSKQTYDYLREKLTLDSGHDNDYYGLAQRLRQRITDMKIKIDLQLRVLSTLKEQVKEQVVDMQRLEVDIDIKLRACKGSCETHHDLHVDRDSYVTLDKQVNQLDAQLDAQTTQSVGTLYVMKSRQMQDAVVVDSVFKSKGVDNTKAGQKTEDVFNDVQTVQLVIGEEGSKMSPATISKVPGTSFSPSSSSTSSTSSKSITELGGGLDFLGGGLDSHASTKSVSCTKRIKTTIVQTKSGPEERREEVMEGGPECQAMTELSGGGLSSFFPGLSSSSTTKTVHSGGAKGSLLDTKTSLGDPFGDLGADLGGFMTATADDDDHPDFQARSVKTTRVERHSGTKPSE